MPKPPSFWYYAIASLMAACIMGLGFWSQVKSDFGWADTGFAFIVGVFCMFILRLCKEWISHPNLLVKAPLYCAVFLFVLSINFTDKFVLHHRNISSLEAWQGIGFAIPIGIFFALSARPVQSPEK